MIKVINKGNGVIVKVPIRRYNYSMGKIRNMYNFKRKPSTLTLIMMQRADKLLETRSLEEYREYYRNAQLHFERKVRRGRRKMFGVT